MSGPDCRPVLPRRIGERLSDLMGVRVEWVALGMGFHSSASHLNLSRFCQ